MHTEYLSPRRITLCPALSIPQEGVILCDAKLWQLYPRLFDSNLAIYPIKASEEAKSWDTLAGIYQFLAGHNLKRSELIQVFGGGIVCDIAAFAAATFKRGCRLRLYPSTLLAMVDAAIGGKSALNHLGQRNLLGSFYPAEEITLYPGFLSTLPEEEVRQGKAEMLKSYLINSALSEVNLETGTLPGAEQILEYANFKMQLCAQDPFDNDIRRILNFGHTYGHAYETLLSYRYKHGDSVVMGMYSELQQSRDEGYLGQTEYQRIVEVLAKYPLPKGIERDICDLDKEEVAKRLVQDKKQGGKMPKATAFRRVELM